MDTSHTVQPFFVTTNSYFTYVSANDEWNYQVSPNVYVDGNYIGTAPTFAMLSGGYHTLSVDQTTYDQSMGYYVDFQYMYDQNNNYYYSNSIYIPITSDTWLTAVYY